MNVSYVKTKVNLRTFVIFERPSRTHKNIKNVGMIILLPNSSKVEMKARSGHVKYIIVGRKYA